MALGSRFTVARYSGEGLPRPVDAGQHRFRGNVLDRGEAAREPLALLWPARRQREAAVAHDYGGDAMPAGAAPDGVPRHLRVHVRVAVDEAGRDDEAVGVDDPLRHRRHVSDLDDAALPDTDVAPVAWRTRAVHDRSIADH